MNGNIYVGQREMQKIVNEAGVHPDDPLCRVIIQCSDPEATAWAWAAGTELGLLGEEIVRDDEYGGDGEAIWPALQVHAYIGVHGLAHAGFCAIREPSWYPANRVPNLVCCSFTDTLDELGARDVFEFPERRCYLVN